MPGRPGRSGGQNRISLEAHVLRGTFNPTLHAHLSAGPSWEPSPADLEPLGSAGQALVARLRDAYDLSPIEGELVLEGAVAADRLADVRDRRTRTRVKDKSTLDRIELAWHRALSNCLLALRARLARRKAAKERVAPPASKWGGMV